MKKNNFIYAVVSLAAACVFGVNGYFMFKLGHYGSGLTVSILCIGFAVVGACALVESLPKAAERISDFMEKGGEL